LERLRRGASRSGVSTTLAARAVSGGRGQRQRPGLLARIVGASTSRWRPAPESGRLRSGERGLEDPALARRAVAPTGVPELAVGAEVALDQPGDAVLEEDLGRPLDLAELPLGLARVVAALEALGRAEVVLGLGRVGDLAPDPREAEDPDCIPFV
jgi:hypothetical protein